MSRQRVASASFVLALAACCLTLGYLLGVHQATSTTTGPANLSPADQRAFGVVWEALSQIEHDYYRRTTLDPQQLADGAARGLVQAVGDPYTRLSAPGEQELTEAELRGSFEGIGLQLEQRDDQLRVVAPLAGSPAERAGLHTGDAILAVDGIDTHQLALADAVSRLRGPSGTSVRLKRQADVQVVDDLTIVRERIMLPSVEARTLGGDAPLGYVRLSIFAEPTAQQLHQALARLVEQGVRGVVLDVRGNPGGYLSSAVDVTSTFVRDGVVLYEEADSRRTPVRTTGSAQMPDMPLAVLVDHGSASAAEIVAAALHDNGRAVVIGQPSFGKGTVQETRTLSDQSLLRLTVGQWFTPAGLSLQGQGIQPDVLVTPVDGNDAALDAAVSYLAPARAHG